MGLSYIIENIDKITSITIKKDDESDCPISVGFSVKPADGDDYNIGEAGMFIGVKSIKDDSELLTYIAAALRLGVKVSEEGVKPLLEAMGDQE